MVSTTLVAYVERLGSEEEVVKGGEGGDIGGEIMTGFDFPILRGMSQLVAVSLRKRFAGSQNETGLVTSGCLTGRI